MVKIAIKGNPFQDASQIMESREVVYSNTELQRIGAIAEAIGKLQDMKHIFAVSDFTPNQIILIAKAQALSAYWNIPQINDLLVNLAILQLSKNRESRKEILKAIMGLTPRKGLKDKVRDISGGDSEDVR